MANAKLDCVTIGSPAHICLIYLFADDRLN